ncbi:MAG TPA: YbaB/EbfC family nucleoid-associated protein [Phycisphaerae bacterium]|nr:YbaB/EbfC family nucleoid-associated protein [Phycisphaerae bacterium]HRY68854.1 YbaB/EbfC family nucleoid-associated protein [Phycisphaerae bacterium]HSA27519.1 YbaB/EbfC family nucleoid-associated protein [Phycisphaerae bacterium]
MLGALGNLGAMLKQAKSLQENMQKIQAELLRKRFEADAGAGLVKAIVDGKGELVQIKIDPKATGDVELLEDMIKAAISAAAQKARESASADIAQLTGGMNIPGLTDLLGQGAK